MTIPSSEYISSRNPRLKVVACIGILLIVTTLPYLYFILFIIPNYQHAYIDDLGKVIAQQLSNSSTEQVVHNDTLALSVILRQLVDDNHVVHAIIYTADNKLLAEAGKLPEEASTDYQQYSNKIMVQESLAGTVQITLRTHNERQIGLYTLSQWVWIIIGWSIIIFFASAAWIAYLLRSTDNDNSADASTTVNALQRILQTLNLNNSTESLPNTTHNDDTYWHIVRSAVLVLEFSNLSMLLQRLNNKTMAKLVDECYANMELSAKLYNGNLSGWLGKNVVICFNGANNETEHYFHAVCCAELIIGLTNYLNERLVKSNLPRIKLRAALHAGDLLTDTDHALTQSPKHMISEIVSIATEICQHADHNQLLISDDLYTSDAIAQRIIISDPHVIVLECIDRPITTYSILDLQPTYRELLTRQIQHLITSKPS